METERNESIFRKKTLERISSPEQLSDYLRVTGPGVWIVLTAVILLLLGLFVWSWTGRLETRSDSRAIVKNNVAMVVSVEGDDISKGMTLIIDSGEYKLKSTGEDDYGRTVAYADVDLPDGSYYAEIVIEEIRPIDFLLRSSGTY